MIKLSKAGKMPCRSWSLQALETCKGAYDMNGEVVEACKGCYALKGNYRFSNVKKSRAHNLQDCKRKEWVNNMVIELDNDRYFRWFDSGDLDSIEQLAAICKVAEETPDIAHWLPTRELAIVRAYKGAIPSNLVIRLSAPMVDMRPVKGANTSTVHKDSTPVGHVCPAPTQGNNCGSCRACWTPSVANVSYKKH